MSTATRLKMRASKKRLWGNKHYADNQRAKRCALKFAQLHGAFTVNPVEEPAMDEFDRWTY